jgi:glycosyltransferase involved in cell wall biosynthesis
VRTDTPSVSVIVPAYNAEETIAECVDSVLAQAYPQERFELIVVDNASTDATSEVVRAYGERLRVVHESRRGAAAARNAGLASASGDVAAFIDADCVAVPGWLRAIVKPLREPSVGMVGGAIRAAMPANFVARFGETIHDNRKSIEVFRPPYVITMNCCAPIAMLKRLDLFDAHFRRSQDVDLSYRAVQASYELVFCGAAVVYHRHPRTLPALFRKGFQHGFSSVRVLKRHRDLVARNGKRRRVSGRAYIGIVRSLVDAVRGPERGPAMCAAVFDSGKRLGKVCGSARFRYLNL